MKLDREITSKKFILNVKAIYKNLILKENQRLPNLTIREFGESYDRNVRDY